MCFQNAQNDSPIVSVSLRPLNGKILTSRDLEISENTTANPDGFRVYEQGFAVPDRMAQPQNCSGFSIESARNCTEHSIARVPRCEERALQITHKSRALANRLFDQRLASWPASGSQSSAIVNQGPFRPSSTSAAARCVFTRSRMLSRNFAHICDAWP